MQNRRPRRIRHVRAVAMAIAAIALAVVSLAQSRSNARADDVPANLTVRLQSAVPDPTGIPLDLRSYATYGDAEAALALLTAGDTVEIPFSGAGLPELSFVADVAADPTTQSVTFTGAALGGVGVNAALTAIWPSAGGTPDLLLAVDLASFTLGDIGLTGPFAAADFGRSVFAFGLPAAGGTLSIPAGAVPPALAGYFAGVVPGGSGGGVTLAPGLNFASGLALSALPTALTSVLNAAAISEVPISGPLGGDFGLISGAGAPSTGPQLSAGLPAFSAAALPSWLAGAAGTSLAVANDAGALAVSFAAGLDATPSAGTTLHFDLAAQIALDASSVALHGSLATPWVAPFGISWLTLSSVDLDVALGGGGASTAALSATITAGAHTIDLAIDNAGGSWTVTGSSAETFSTADLAALFSGTAGITVPAGLPPLTISGVSLSIDTGIGGIALTGTAPLFGVPTNILASVQTRGGTRSFVLGARASSFTLGSLVSDLPSIVGSITVPEIAFAYADVPAGTSLPLPSGSLAAPELAFFAPAFGSPPGGFTLTLEPGLNLAGEIPVTVLPQSLRDALGLAPADAVTLEGSVGLAVNGGAITVTSFALHAGVRTGTFPALPSWIAPDGTPLTLAIDYSAAGTSFEVGKGFNATIGGSTLPFSIAVVVDSAGAVTVSGASTGAWVHPFGVGWLTLSGLAVVVSDDGAGGTVATITGDGTLSGKQLSVTVTVDSPAGGPVTTTVSATSTSSFTTSELLSGFGFTPPAGFPALTVSGLVLEIDSATGGVAVTGGVTFLGVSADVLVSSQLRGGTPSFLLGVSTQDFTLGTVAPGLPAVIGDITIPALAFAYADVPAGSELVLTGASLAGPEAAFFRPAFGIPAGDPPSFTLNLTPGLNLAGELPLSLLPADVLTATGLSDADSVLLEGTVGLAIDLGAGTVDVTSASLRASLPGSPTLPGLPSWLAGDGAQPLELEVDYDGTGAGFRIAGGFVSTLDGTSVPFRLGLALDSGGAVEVTGATTQPWVHPFGIGWLTLDAVSASFTSDGATQTAQLAAGATVDGHALTVSILVEETGGVVSTTITASSPDTYTTNDLINLFGSAIGVTVPSGLPALSLTSVALEIDSSGNVSLTGDSAFLGVTGAVLVSAQDRGGGREFLLGVRLNSFTLGDISSSFPAAIAGITLPAVSFAYADVPGGGSLSISGGDLTGPEAAFFGPAFGIPSGGAPNFSLELAAGLNLSGRIPLSALPSAMVSAAGLSSSGYIQLEGTIALVASGGSVSIGSASLSATLPGTPSIPGLPDWITGDPLEPLQLEVAYDGTDASFRFAGGFVADLGGTDLGFRIYVGLATDGSVSLGGESTTPWANPFGISWLTLNQVGIAFSTGGGTTTGSLTSSFDVGAKTLGIEFTVTSSGGTTQASIVASASSLSSSDLIALLNLAGLPTSGFSLPSITATNVQVALAGGGGSASFALSGDVTLTSLSGSPSATLMITVASGSAGPQVVAGFKMDDFSLAQIVPDLAGTPVAAYELDTLALVIAVGNGGKVDRSTLAPPVQSFFDAVYGSSDYKVDLRAGVSLLGSMAPPSGDLSTIFNALGTGGGNIVIGGTIPAPPGFPGAGAGGVGVTLLASLPPMAPPGSPDWFRYGQLSLFIEVGSDGFGFGLRGELGVTIEENAGKTTDLTFSVEGEIAGPPLSLNLIGLLTADEPWVAPFDISWLTINQLGIALSYDAVIQSFGLGLTGNVELASKNTGVAIGLEINASGVPTNIVFDGNSTSSWGFDDMVELYKVFSGDASASLGSVPNIELRPVESSTPIRLKFALKDSPFVSAGFGLSGALWAETVPGGPLQLIAVADVSVSTAGIHIFGNAPVDIPVGPITLSNPLVRIDVEFLPPSFLFIVTGDLATPFGDARIDVDIDLDSSDAIDVALQAVADAEAAWNSMGTAFSQDPVIALANALTGLYATLDLPPPAWLTDVLEAVDDAKVLMGGQSASDVVLDAALFGIVIPIPVGFEYPDGGVASTGCGLFTPQQHTDGRCYTFLPFDGIEQGFRTVWECPFPQVYENGNCWSVPPSVTSSTSTIQTCALGWYESGGCWWVTPSSTSTRSKVDNGSWHHHCDSRGFLGICTSGHWHWHSNYQCPIGTVSSGGKCYVWPPGAPSGSGVSPQTGCPIGYIYSGGGCWLWPIGPPVPGPSAPQLNSYCDFGEIQGGKCWVLFNAPTPGTPAGGADPACGILTPFFENGRCYTVPPSLGGTDVRIGGICTALGIACSKDDLLGDTIFRPLQDAVRSVLAPFQAPDSNSPPVARAGGPYTVLEGQTVALNGGSSSDPDGDALSYAWDLDGDGQFDDAVGASPPFSAVGRDGPSSVTVRLRVTDTSGESSTDAATVNIVNVPPTLSATGPATTAEGATYTLTLAATDPGSESVTWTIAWGDGATGQVGGAGTTASHVFDGSVDTPVIRVTAIDDDGSYALVPLAVTVTNAPPVVTATLPGGSTAVEGASVALTGTVADPGIGDAVTVDVDWGDGGTSTATLPAGTPTYTFAHTYVDDGPSGTPQHTYAIAVTADDGDGGSDSASASVTVHNVAPAVFVGDATGDEGADTVVSGGISDAGVLDTFTVAVNWGDGTPVSTFNEPAGTALFSYSHVYADDGTYNATVTVTDDDTGSASAVSVVTVANVVPGAETLVVAGGGGSATFSAAGLGANPTAVDVTPPLPIAEHDTVQLTAQLRDPGDDALSVTIDWGDSSTPTTLTLASNERDIVASHTYLDDLPGDDAPYPISVTIGDDGTVDGQADAAVLVTNVAPSGVTLTLDATAIDEGQTVALDGTFVDPGTIDTHTVTIDWGDTSPSTVLTLPEGARTFAADHQYVDDNPTGTTSDAYAIQVTVEDDDLDSGSGSTVITVDNVAPTVNAGGDRTVDEGDLVSLDPATFGDVGVADTHTATIDWDDGSAVDTGSVTESGGSGTVDASHVYADNGTYTVEVCVTDDDLAETCDTFTVTVNNVVPTLDAGANQTVDEGDLVSLDPATFNDLGTADSHTATVNWGDGTATDAGVVTEAPFGPPGSTAGADGSVAGAHVYADNGTYTVEVCVTDDDLATACDTSTVVVNNKLPTIDAGADQTVDEGDLVSLDPATFNDLGTADTHTATVDWGDGTPVDAGAVTETPFGPPGDTAGADGTVDASHVYADNGTYTVEVCVTDDDLATACDTSTVVVHNVAPLVTGAPQAAAITSTVVQPVTATFTDAGALDTHTATVDWGDGSAVEAVAVDQEAGGGSLAAEHRYWYPGSYVVTITVTDDDGAATTDDLAVDVHGPQDRMREAIGLLAPYRQNKRVDKAIKEIEKGLDARLWVDEIHLDGKHGQSVFDHDRHAVRELMKALGKAVAPDPEDDDKGRKDALSSAGQAAAVEAIDLLVDADWSLAHVAMLGARNASLDGLKDSKRRNFEKDMLKAEEAFADAARELAAGRSDRAIEDYRTAWDQATKALDKAGVTPVED